MPAVSVIVPVLNEAAALPALLETLAAALAPGDEIIVADGGSDDASAALAGQRGVRVIEAARGRARQMNAGAAAAGGEVLWFVHADSRVDPSARAALGAALDGGAAWGRFDVRLDDPAWPFRLIEGLMNRRSRLTGIATGDQALFVRRALFAELGGFPDIALMEDIELSARLRRAARPACLRTPVVTSARRWRRHGIVRTVLLMWGLRLAWFCGVPADRLARLYADA